MTAKQPKAGEEMTAARNLRVYRSMTDKSTLSSRQRAQARAKAHHQDMIRILIDGRYRNQGKIEVYGACSHHISLRFKRALAAWLDEESRP